MLSLRPSRVLYGSAMSLRCLSGSSSTPALISATGAMQLAASSGNVKFVDGSWYLDPARSASAEFMNERIAGAVQFDINDICDKCSPLPHMLPSAEEFTLKARKIGLNGDDHIVVYAGRDCFSAPRVWWTLKIFGHERTSVLDGGFEAWKRAGGRTESGEMGAVAPGNITGLLDTDCVVNAEQVLQIVKTGSAQICDARSAARFNGDAPEPRPGLVSGHIPGSLNLPFGIFSDPDDVTTYKKVEEIKNIIEEAGVVVGTKTVTTCGSGVTAACISFALHRLGAPLASVPIYDGSWAEWGQSSRTDLPKVGRDNA